MKSKLTFNSLKKRLLFNVFLNAVLAFLACCFLLPTLMTVLKKPFFAVFESLLMYIFNYTRNEMQLVYDQIFRRNMNLIIFTICTIFIVFFIYQAIVRVVKYLREIETVVGMVADETSPPIVLSKELAPIAAELNNAKNLLAQRNAQVLEATHKKNELIMYLAHDLKTPLTSITGYLNLLLDREDISPDMRLQYLNIALEKSQRLNLLLNEFFLLTKLNGSKESLSYSQINLGLLLNQVCDEFYPSLIKKSLSLNANIEDNITINGDSEKLMRVFSNLLKNAINYCDPSTEITVCATASNGSAQITVENIGQPISPDKLEIIFDQFIRLDASRNTASGGSGLGLAISKEILELHDGTICAQSNHEKTIFIVTLPLKTDSK